jgi:NAD(P)-dependent dehydrogenase (short-subunit alcohol dehydrogenase family)
MHIAGHTILVTGGSSGLGAACAQLLARIGAQVVIADLDRQLGEALALDLGARFVLTDVTDEASTSAAVRAAAGLRGVVHCAGIGHAERLLGKAGPHSLDAFTRVIRINLIGTFNVARLAAAAIAQAEPGIDGERGAIILTASVAAFEGQIGQAAYAASKGGVAGLTLPLARELARSGIRVVSIAPGIFDTPLLAGLPEPARVSLGQQVPFPPRLGRPEEYAALVQHIFENVMLNGEVIRLDGALRMAPK